MMIRSSCFCVGRISATAICVAGKIASSDPDVGSWTYTYNALGLPVSQTNAKGQTVSLTEGDQSMVDQIVKQFLKE